MDKPVSEEQDDSKFQPRDKDTSDKSDEEITGAEAASVPGETYRSKSGHISWSAVSPGLHGRATAENVTKMTPGITRCAVTRIRDIKTCFNLLLILPLFLKVIIAMTIL